MAGERNEKRTQVDSILLSAAQKVGPVCLDDTPVPYHHKSSKTFKDHLSFNFNEAVVSISVSESVNISSNCIKVDGETHKKLLNS